MKTFSFKRKEVYSQMFGSTFYSKQGEENLLIHEDLRTESQI